MQEKEKRREDLKRLKNLKKREIMDKIEKLRDVAGDTAVGFTEEDVQGEFNEHEYDEMMKVACYCLILAHLCFASFLSSCLFKICIMDDCVYYEYITHMYVYKTYR